MIKQTAEIAGADRPKPSWRRVGVVAAALGVILLTVTWASLAVWGIVRLFELL